MVDRKRLRQLVFVAKADSAPIVLFGSRLVVSLKSNAVLVLELRALEPFFALGLTLRPALLNTVPMRGTELAVSLAAVTMDPRPVEPIERLEPVTTAAPFHGHRRWSAVRDDVRLLFRHHRPPISARPLLPLSVGIDPLVPLVGSSAGFAFPFGFEPGS